MILLSSMYLMWLDLFRKNDTEILIELLIQNKPFNHLGHTIMIV